MAAEMIRGLGAWAGAIANRPVLATALGAIGVSTWGGVSLVPGWGPAGWLVLTAISGQVLGWLLVALGSPLLPVEASSALLLLTPIGERLQLLCQTGRVILENRGELRSVAAGVQDSSQP